MIWYCPSVKDTVKHTVHKWGGGVLFHQSRGCSYITYITPTPPLMYRYDVGEPSEDAYLPRFSIF